MANNTTSDLLKYLLIDQRLRMQIQPSLEDLTEYLREELKELGKLEVTPLSIKGQVKRMRRLFHAPISFNFTKNAYFYKIPNYNIFKLPAGVLSDFITTLKMNQTMGGSYSSLENIKYEHARSCAHAHTGSKYVPIIAKAIAEKKVISLKVKTAGSKRAFQYEPIPCIIYQQEQKWKLLGKINSEYKVFVLEELQAEPEITNKKADIPALKESEAQIPKKQ